MLFPPHPGPYSYSKVIHRRRGELYILSPQPTVNNFGGTKTAICEQMDFHLQKRWHAELGRRITPPLSRGCIGRDFRSQLCALGSNEFSEVVVSTALYKAFAGPKPRVTPKRAYYEQTKHATELTQLAQPVHSHPARPGSSARSGASATSRLLGGAGLGRQEALSGGAHQPHDAAQNALHRAEA